MKKLTALRVLLRSRLKTALTLLLVAAATFLFLYNLLEYDMTNRQYKETMAQYWGNLTLDRSSFEVEGPGGKMRLGNKEFQMLEMLMRNPKKLISTESFMYRIWGYDSESEQNVVWVYISNLRKKLASLQANVAIKVSRNAGYSLEETND